MVPNLGDELEPVGCLRLSKRAELNEFVRIGNALFLSPPRRRVLGFVSTHTHTRLKEHQQLSRQPLPSSTKRFSLLPRQLLLKNTPQCPRGPTGAICTLGERPGKRSISTPARTGFGGCDQDGGCSTKAHQWRVSSAWSPRLPQKVPREGCF